MPELSPQQATTTERAGQPAIARARVDDAPAYDLLMGLAALAQPTAQTRWQPWAAEMAGRFSTEERRLLRRWFSGEIAMGSLPMTLIPALPEPRDARALLAGLAALPLGDFMRALVAIHPVDSATPLAAKELLALRGDQAAVTAYVDAYVHLAGHSRGNLIRALIEPELARAELLALLRAFQERVFAELAPHLAEERARAAARLRELAALPQEEAPDWLTGLHTLDGFDLVVLAPAVLREARTMVYFHEIERPLYDSLPGEPFILIVGTELILRPTPVRAHPRRGGARAPAGMPDPAERWAKAHSALGDPTRLRLLRLLAERPAYGEEVAVALGISPTTVSHHVSVLSRAGLVAMERRAHRTYFTLRAEALGELLRGTEDFLKGADR